MLAAACSAPAATVTYILDLNPPEGKFAIYAQTSVGDNAGLALYATPLVGTVLTFDHRSPYTINSANFQPAGFSTLRTFDQSGPQTDPVILALQDYATGPLTNMLYGFGQQAGTWPPGITPFIYPDSTSDTSWSVPALIAMGTYSGSLYFNRESVDLVASVFASSGSRETFPATVFAYEAVCALCPGPAVDDVDLGNVALGTIVTAKLPGGFVDVPEWTLESFTGPDGAVAGAAVDGNTGQFTWNSSGAPLGNYSAVISYFHFEAGGDTGILTFNLVPEPTFAATIGAVLAAGMFRRRPLSTSYGRQISIGLQHHHRRNNYP
jgi:hypothetical protein